MGEARVTTKIRNFVDVALAERHVGSLDQVPMRQRDCLVDTGALMVLLRPRMRSASAGWTGIVTYADDRREESPAARGYLPFGVFQKVTQAPQELTPVSLVRATSARGKPSPNARWPNDRKGRFADTGGHAPDLPGHEP
ncbi:hypothetical protein [Imhoffiella purpurea]|uniref:hypothetical protein n=1 Tax=Imhoffiella purpurea TaxID=1249627 RepID=UPI0012FDDFE8|nr:hypothetical protein [Imhoffiella purpurea]